MQKITSRMWDKLSEEQKLLFSQHVGEEFGQKILPTYRHVLIFLSNNGITTGIKMLKKNEDPPLVKSIEELWEKVIIFLNDEE